MTSALFGMNSTLVLTQASNQVSSSLRREKILKFDQKSHLKTNY